MIEENCLPFNSNTTYLDITLNRTFISLHTLNNYITTPMAKRDLKSKKTFVNKAQTLLAYNTDAPTWIHDTWNKKWSKNISLLHSFISEVGSIATEYSNFTSISQNY